MCDANRRPRGVLPALVLSLCLATACGGGGAGGVGGGGGGGGGNDAPAATVLAPLVGVSGLLGDTFVLAFTSDDDDAATVRFYADLDGVPTTTGDQVPLFVGTDGNGAPQSATITLQAPLALGVYSLFLEVDDGVNAVLRVPLPAPLRIYPAIAGVAPPRSNRYGVVSGMVGFSRGEAEDGTGPLNGDGLSDDGVLVLYDADNAALVQPTPSVSMDVTPAAGARVRPLFGQFGTLAWLTLEVDEGVNLNGANGQNPIPPLGGADGDTADAMVSYVVPRTNPAPITNTYGGATAIVGMADDQILVRYAEAGEGAAGTVMNLDLDTADSFFGYVDPTAPGPPFEFNQVVFHTVFPGPSANLVFRNAGVFNAGWLVTDAGGPALLDPNLDFDQGDTFLALASLLAPGGAGAPGLFLGLAAGPFGPAPVDPTGGFDVSADGYAGFYLSETSDNLLPGGAAGNDRNGDAILGLVPVFYDTNTLTQTIPLPGGAGLPNAAPGSPLVYDGTRMFFTAMEAPRIDPAPGTNADGDGGADLQVLWWTDHGVAVPTSVPLVPALGPGLPLAALSLDQGGSIAKLSDGWLAVIVNEFANGGQDINGSGAVDMAYLLVETAPVGNGPPVVHNPKLVPSTAGTIPLAGIWGEDTARLEQGVVVRVTELANGNLDGDGNATEILLAYISFATPTEPRFLDAGGDHCAVGDGRIGVTANEAFTGEDYDGNGAATNYVFRVLDFRGTVLESGRPCSLRSVPVTETGRVWAYLRDEATEGRNLNGDGDTTDLILGLWVP